jgi:hypothetical protein
VPALRSEEYVAVRAFGPDGALVTDGQVRTGYASENGRSSGSSTVIERPDGVRWVLHHPANGTDAGGRNWIEVASPRYGTLRHEYPAGRAGSVDLRFGAPARVEVEVTGVSGTRYEGRVEVALSATTDPVRFVDGPRAKAGDAGTFVVPSVQPGAYDLVLRLQSRSRWGGEIHREPVHVVSGGNRFAVALPELHVVTVEGVVGSAFLHTTPREGLRHNTSAQAGSDGRAVFDGLPAGEYEAHSGGRKATFRVPGTSVVRLVE